MKRFFLYTFLLGVLFLNDIFARSGNNKICLNMIVKDEKDVIKRCLDSLKNFIDYIVILDTGSTDGTQKIIKNYMKDIPGELHEYHWIDFAFNRNMALKLAKEKGEYLLFMDADDRLIFENDFIKPNLDKDFYNIKVKHGPIEHYRVHVIKDSLDWKWEGIVHEGIDCSYAKTSGIIDNVYNLISTDGARSKDPDKFIKDAKKIEKALEKEPNNTRYVFYLAQSYRDARNYPKAIENYEKRVSLGGWDQEVYYSLYQIACIQMWNNEDPDIFINSFLRAFNYRPSRKEPLYYISTYYRKAGNYELAYNYAKQASEIPYTTDILFVEDWVYKYGILLELSISAYWIKRFEESKEICEQILIIPDLPEHIRSTVKKNLKFANEKINDL